MAYSIAYIAILKYAFLYSVYWQKIFIAYCQVKKYNVSQLYKTIIKCRIFFSESYNKILAMAISEHPNVHEINIYYLETSQVIAEWDVILLILKSLGEIDKIGNLTKLLIAAMYLSLSGLEHISKCVHTLPSINLQGGPPEAVGSVFKENSLGTFSWQAGPVKLLSQAWLVVCW